VHETGYTVHDPEDSRVCLVCCPGLMLPQVPAASAVFNVLIPRFHLRGDAFHETILC
jgi:hypothetical protein